MTSASDLSDDLAFLAAYMDSDGPRYRTAYWLGSDYYADVWRVLCDQPFSIDWRIELGSSGELLTSPRFATLLDTFKTWLIVQTHVDWTGKLAMAPRSQASAVRRALHCIDYLLLNADKLRLADHGLGSLTVNDVQAMLAAIASNRLISTSVYSWPTRLAALLRREAASLSNRLLQTLLRNAPAIAEALPDREDWVTDLSDDEVVRARAWLFHTRGYLKMHNLGGFELSPHTTKLAKVLYAHTVTGFRISHPVPLELGLCPGHRVGTEFPRARVTSERKPRMGTFEFSKYSSVLTSLALLEQTGFHVPVLSSEALEGLRRSLELKKVGRYRTLPQGVLFPALRSAIEFALRYGDALIACYLQVAESARRAEKPIGEFVHDNGIDEFLTPEVKSLGVNRWAIEWCGTAPAIDDVPTWLNPAQYYSELRQNAGLFECLLVLFGAVQIVIGALTARRQGELIGLVAFQALDVTRTRLVFENRKSGIAGLRETEARPIPSLVVDLVSMFEHLQEGLLEIGALRKPTNLFATPINRGQNTLRVLQVSSYNLALNYFCDWVQTPLDGEGKRYYIRQHQLRRFFCMLFFWGGSFGGLETLRWFLGHTDPAHLWHYITESTPGLAVRSVAAEWAAYGVQHGTPETEALGKILKEHFGTSRFDALDAEILQPYIEDLLEAGKVTIQPEFLDSGKQYRIAVIVRELQHE